MSTPHTGLTIDERDTIDRAKRRIRAFSTALRAMANIDDEAEFVAANFDDCVFELAEAIAADIVAIDDAFKAADKREEGGAR